MPTSAERIRHVPGTTGAREIPPHVPAALVREPGYEGPNTRIDPFSVTEGIFEALPPVFYWPRPSPGRYDGVWVVTRYADIREIYQNDALYSTHNAANFQSLVGESFQMIPLAIDPPDHAKYRILLNPWFSPKAVSALEPRMRAVINELIDGFADAGACDAAYDFGRLYPVRVFLDLMKLPQEKLEDFLTWEYSILHSHRNVDKIKFGVANALEYLRSFIEQMREQPNDGLAAHIVHGRIDGRPLTDDEIIGAIFFLWVGGLDTVAATTSLMFRRLALQPELQEQLRRNPALIPNAIEEFLRVQPLVNSSRLVKQDHEIAGMRLKAGDHVMCYNLAGNFDPDEFENPRQIDFERSPNRHFTLAGGPHRCLGSHLARRELAIALGEFLRRVPTFGFRPGADLTAYPGLIAAPRVPLVWNT